MTRINQQEILAMDRGNSKFYTDKVPAVQSDESGKDKETTGTLLAALTRYALA